MKRVEQLVLKNRCMDPAVLSEVLDLQKYLQDSWLNADFLYISKKAKQIARHFIDSNCYPIGDDMTNLAVQTYIQASGLEYLAARNTGNYTGNVDRLVVFLDGLREDRSLPGVIADEIARLTSALEEGERIRPLWAKNPGDDKLKDKATLLGGSIDMGMYVIEDYLYAESGMKTDPGCDKVAIFFSYLKGLQESGRVRTVTVFTVPYEGELQYIFKDDFPDKATEEAGTELRRACKVASEHGVKCVDLSPYFYSHYSDPLNNALTVDDGHLTPEGNRLVAGWMLNSL